MADANPPSAAALPIIRATFAFTVLGAAAFAVTQHREREVDPALLYLPVVLAVVNFGLALFFRDRAAGDPARARTNAVIAWAMGESAALFGWIVHFLGGPLAWALPGTIGFGLILWLVPPPPEGSGSTL